MMMKKIVFGMIMVSVSAVPELLLQEPEGGGLYFSGAIDDDEANANRGLGYYHNPYNNEINIGYVGASLRSLVVDAEIVDGAATRVTIVQEFATPAELPAGFDYSKAIYQLPLDESATVIEFFAESEERTIVAVVKDREKAQEEFDEAVEDGNFAVLAQQIRRDLFHISVGNLPLNEIVRVTLSYVTMLGTVGTDASRFVFPTALAPRYEPEENSQGFIPGGLDMIHNGVNINIKATSTVTIETIYSNTHDVIVEFEDDYKLAANVTVTDENPTDRDVVVVIKTVANYQPRIFVESSDEHNTMAFMLAIVPDIVNDNDRKQEYVFIVDRSGSMAGPKVEQLRLAMDHILETIPKTGIFNIVGFGQNFEPLFKEGSRRSDDKEAMLAAQNYVKAMDADLGGTEILEPLKHVLNQELLSNYARNVFVLTDGEVSNTDDVIEYVRSKRAQGRVFALGIGSHVSSALVKGIARAGRGTAEFVDGDEAAAVESAVERQMTVATTPALDDVRVDWGISSEGEETPYEAPPLLAYQRFVAYYLVPGNVVPKTVRIYSGDNVEYEVNQDSFVVRSEADDLLHKMACKSLIRDLEDGAHDENLSKDEVKGEIVLLGEKYQIASSETSFVAVDDGNWTEANGPQVDKFDFSSSPLNDDDVNYDTSLSGSWVGFFEECEISIFPTVSMLTCLFDVAREVLLAMIQEVYEMFFSGSFF